MRVAQRDITLEQIGTVKRLPSWITVLPSLVVPVCLGLSLYLGLQYLIDTHRITDELALRYLTGHPVSKITVAMFFVGLSSLLVLGWNLIGQFGGENNISLGEASNSELSRQTSHDVRETAVDHGQYLLDLPNRYHSHVLWDRLVAAVHSIYRTGSTASVEDELKYLSDMEQERQQQRYSLVRILIWATPMLGFLGTVLGISQALGGIAIGPENDFQEMINGLRGNLYIAFDTTALALTLSMLMMFGLFLVERFDSQLLRLVDQRAHAEIARHYEIAASGSFDTVQVVEAIQNVVVSQTEIWRDSIRKAEQAWTASLTQTSGIVRNQLTESLDENIAAMAHYLGEAIEKADMSISHRWSQWQVSLSENARMMEQHLVNLGTQTKSVQDIVGALGESTTFDKALQHQKDAVMATTRTHRVLNELLDKVQEAKLLDASIEPARVVETMQATVPVANHQQANLSVFQSEPCQNQTVGSTSPAFATAAASSAVATSVAPEPTVLESTDEQSFEEADGDTFLLIFSNEDDDESESEDNENNTEDAAPEAEQNLDSPQMKIFSAAQNRDAVADEAPAARYPVTPIETELPVPSSEPVAIRTPAPERTLAPEPKPNESRSAKIARLLTEVGEIDQASKADVKAADVYFRDPNKANNKRAA